MLHLKYSETSWVQNISKNEKEICNKIYLNIFQNTNIFEPIIY